MQGTYFLCGLLIAALVLFPDDTINAFTALGIKIQIYYLNYRMKFMAWQMHRSLIKLCKEAGFPSPGPFRFVNLWDRES